MWRIARDSGTLDLNSSYSYLLWCRDFAATTVVAEDGDDLVGFLTGYRRPDATDTLVVWQVAVDARTRGRGLGRAMLDQLSSRDTGCRFLEATVTEDNDASLRLFSAFARERSAGLERRMLFDTELFPDSEHAAEMLLRIGPFRPP